jgi:tetratricopeptide (TPR) repeat protein
MENKRRDRQGWHLAILLLAGLVVYSNTIQSPFHFDDHLSIVDNPVLRNLSRLKDIWGFWPTRFITYLSFAVDYHVHQLRVPGYHLVNVAIHLGSAALVWRLGLLTFATQALRGREIAKSGRLISLLASLIFVTHPVQTQAVTYIVQRVASLATFFYLASLCLYVKSRLMDLQHAQGGSRKLIYGASLAMGAASMFSKETTLTLPLMIGLYEYAFLKKEGRFEARRLAPFIILALLIPLTMILTKSVNIGELRRSGEPVVDISSGSYFLTQFKVVAIYLRLLLVPVNQNIDYDIPVARSFFDPPVLAGLLLIAGLLFAAAKLFRGNRLLSFGIFWFFLALLPESSVIPIRDALFEHRLYLPMVGFSFFLPAALYTLFEKKDQKMTVAVSVFIIVCYAGTAYARNGVWRSDLVLWDDAVRKSPNKARPYNNRGLAYAVRGENELALVDFTQALKLDPAFAEAYNNRGNVYLGRGEFGLALDDYNRAAEKGPRYAEAYHNRGLVYANKNALDQAVLDYNRALEIRPGYAEAYYDRGNAYYRKGDFDRAILDYGAAIALEPDYAEAYHNRGSAFFRRGETARAALDYDAALKIRPDYTEARNNRVLIK